MRARRAGESEARLDVLAAWREAPFFTEAERAALEWAEALTRIHEGVSEELYAKVRRYFDETQLVALTAAVVAINARNRWAISMGSVPAGDNPTGVGTVATP
jgi:alkylhydroperoxidase family enzyme